MSRLKLFWPDGPAGQYEAGDNGDPAILPFQKRVERGGRDWRNDALSRARCIQANSQCPVCRHPVTEPIELNDGIRSRSNMTIPGTATLVGFRCQRCGSEWPV